MNSRERVQAAINHQEPDRAPVDFGAHRSSGISAIAYARLKKALGIETGDFMGGSGGPWHIGFIFYLVSKT